MPVACCLARRRRDGGSFLLLTLRVCSPRRTLRATPLSEGGQSRLPLNISATLTPPLLCLPLRGRRHCLPLNINSTLTPPLFRLPL